MRRTLICRASTTKNGVRRHMSPTAPVNYPICSSVIINAMIGNKIKQKVRCVLEMRVRSADAPNVVMYVRGEPAPPAYGSEWTVYILAPPTSDAGVRLVQTYICAALNAHCPLRVYIGATATNGGPPTVTAHCTRAYVRPGLRHAHSTRSPSTALAQPT
jgi:hypothetical protein